ncbi:MAG: Anaerobic nitric oxide reductase transcription regulator NorR [Planctomycetes bacterium]|nr:Anaerobic nitric oxide reductase transcription regulator NorR [Planctomycetota bacterium]
MDDDLAASLPPALRRAREGSPVRAVLARLAAEAENGPSASEGAPHAGGPPGDPMDQERLLKLLEINKQLNLAEDMRALLDVIMDVATATTGAERGFLIVVEDGRISFQTARNFRKEEVAKPELKISSSLAKRVLKSGQAVLTDNAREDERFAEFKSVERLELKSILCVPFRAAGTVIGALYLDNPARKGAFGPGDLQFLSALGDQAAIAIRNMRHAEQMAAANRSLASNLERKSAELETASRALSERATKHAYEEIVGASQPIREILLLLDKVVETDVPVLIQGESGTGKELIAKAIHRYGRRRDAPFVAVNCGAITETLLESELFGHARGAFTGAVGDKKGLFEAAQKGTVFLDEIGEMSPDMQKKLLRVLQEREVRPVGGKNVVKIDVRVVAATNRDLRKMTQEGRFREDLYYRVAVIGIQIPPLRDRAEDIPPIVDRCMARAASELGLQRKPVDDDAMEALQSYAWPGNVRELDNEVKKALTLSGDRITLADLSPEVQKAREAHGPEPSLVPGENGGRHDGAIELDADGGKLKDHLERAEKALIERALERTGQNQTRAAKELGISRVWLRKKMEKYGLLPPPRD